MWIVAQYIILEPLPIFILFRIPRKTEDEGVRQFELEVRRGASKQKTVRRSYCDQMLDGLISLSLIWSSWHHS